MPPRSKAASIGAVALLASVLALCGAVWITSHLHEQDAPSELVSQRTKNWFKPLAPIEESDDLYIYWGEGIDRHDSARVVHSNLALSHAPEYIHSFEGQTFRGLTLACCATLVIPPFAHGFPVHAHDSNIARRIARFVAQGNTAVVTGGVTDLLFLNAYFGFHLEPVDGSYAPGPFVRRYSRIPAAFHHANIPSKLHQVFVQATAVDRASLPFGSVILYDDMQAGTPVFILRYCMINNPKIGEPPLAVNPMSCEKWAKRKNPCGCGNIVYIGFDYRDQNEKDWNSLLRGLVDFVQHPPTPPPKKGGAAAKKSKKMGRNMELAELSSLVKKTRQASSSSKAGKVAHAIRRRAHLHHAAPAKKQTPIKASKYIKKSKA